jgi:hypothetical protein
VPLSVYAARKPNWFCEASVIETLTVASVGSSPATLASRTIEVTDAVKPRETGGGGLVAPPLLLLLLLLVLLLPPDPPPPQATSAAAATDRRQLNRLRASREMVMGPTPGALRRFFE